MSKDKVNVKIALANRSFATSDANCRYPQLSTSIEAYSFIDKNGDIQNKLNLEIESGKFEDITVKFAPNSAEYPLSCAKVLLFIKQGESYQIPILGIHGQPQLVALEQNLLDVSRINPEGGEIRIRNDGSAPAFVGIQGGEPDITIIQPGASEIVAYNQSQKELKLSWGNDYLRLLSEGCQGKGQWAEMVKDLIVDEEDVETMLEEQTEVITLCEKQPRAE